ncbi:hypothetical protein MRB53_031244 [Persea americana]|uniref:Uncharacterized protein n=1 Tax=Persea americana TaxID=3435 RepID=A0ACC2KP04_PERAE|nr:hypothetical protein MRB53_031244 [Persea americana]
MKWFFSSSALAGLGVVSADRFSWGVYKERTLQSPGKASIAPSFHDGVASLHLSSASAPLVNGKLGNLGWKIPSLPRRHAAGPRSPLVPQASTDIPYSWRHPPMTKKPRWWWRTLACLPYLMPLHGTWLHAETAYHLHPFLEELEFLTEPFLGDWDCEQLDAACCVLGQDRDAFLDSRCLRISFHSA